ncbi:MAG: aspartate carbamoyltransferase regulatory subunit [Chlamydiales bacterium]|nr:aspartate carbamoyltransferase regulatory subunit [Chlamydiia bacterium]MCP5508356.1 aspartate carbamoyltransferase regulatory subunit [Chlamydiales bacterium]
MTATVTKTLAVAAIKTGTVIDHIPAGRALQIAQQLRLESYQEKVSIGLNLKSNRHGRKDLIKISWRTLTTEEIHAIAIIAPEATLNIIEDYEVVEKRQVEVPKTIQGIACCQNRACITNHETVHPFFYVNHEQDGIRLQCRYCRKQGILTLR